jgi:hypothetical protein
VFYYWACGAAAVSALQAVYFFAYFVVGGVGQCYYLFLAFAFHSQYIVFKFVEIAAGGLFPSVDVGVG